MKDLLKKLSDMRGISGFEYRISDEIADLFRPVCDEVNTDTLGNVIAIKRCGKPDAPKVMIEAHMDEIGLMVSGIDENGFLSFINIGGVDCRILPAAEVTVHAKRDLTGVIGAKPPHLQAAGEAKKSTQIKDMRIDLGMNVKEVRKLVSVGDSITLAQSCGELLGGRYSGKSLDDRASVAALIKTMENLERIKLEVDVYAVAAVCEEVGGRGAQVSGFDIMPDLAIAIDVTHAITPDNSKNAFELGSGVAISVGPNIHPALSNRLIATAKSGNIQHSIEVEGGDTGTDAWILQVVNTGIPTGLLSIPLRYMHTSVETLAISDVEAVSDLMVRFIAELDAGLEEWLCY